jgi:hypothetical protein
VHQFISSSGIATERLLAERDDVDKRKTDA